MRKKRPYGAGTVYQRSSDQRWVAAVTIDGTRHSFYRHSEADAWAVIAEYSRQRAIRKQLDTLQKTAAIKFF